MVVHPYCSKKKLLLSFYLRKKNIVIITVGVSSLVVLAVVLVSSSVVDEPRDEKKLEILLPNSIKIIKPVMGQNYSISLLLCN